MDNFSDSKMGMGQHLSPGRWDACTPDRANTQDIPKDHLVSTLTDVEDIITEINNRVCFMEGQLFGLSAPQGGNSEPITSTCVSSRLRAVSLYLQDINNVLKRMDRYLS